MSTPHKATAEQWARQEEFAAGSDMLRCLLELRARVEALEAGATCPHVRTSDEGSSYCTLAEQVAAMESAAPPSSSLVERVAIAAGLSHVKARAAIRELAVALREVGELQGWLRAFAWLQQEADR